MRKEQIKISSIDQTKQFAQEIVKKLIKSPNDKYLLLSGDLGAGKTTLTKEILKIMGVEKKVTSPTFVIMNQYETLFGLKINHVDAYRLNKESEELEMYLEEFENAFNVIEWYENLNLNLKEIKWIKINIKLIDDQQRVFEIEEN